MLKKIGIIALFAITLNGCAYIQNSQNEHSAKCKRLKNLIIMNGATGDPREAQQQKATLSRLNKSYEDEKCS
jgi:hypothetical protein